jgi:hypothetical protein
MGVLTDFVVAAPEDARRIAESICPSREFNGLDAKGIDTVKLGTLYAILTGTPASPKFMGGKSLLHSHSDEGPWVMLVPPELVKRLAAVAIGEIPEVASRWAATNEFFPKYDNWTLNAVSEVLKRLADLCRQATAEGKSVLMWMCL